MGGGGQRGRGGGPELLADVLPVLAPRAAPLRRRRRLFCRRRPRRGYDCCIEGPAKLNGLPRRPANRRRAPRPLLLPHRLRRPRRGPLHWCPIPPAPCRRRSAIRVTCRRAANSLLRRRRRLRRPLWATTVPRRPLVATSARAPALTPHQLARRAGCLLRRHYPPTAPSSAQRTGCRRQPFRCSPRARAGRGLPAPPRQFVVVARVRLSSRPPRPHTVWTSDCTPAARAARPSFAPASRRCSRARTAPLSPPRRGSLPRVLEADGTVAGTGVSSPHSPGPTAGGGSRTARSRRSRSALLRLDDRVTGSTLSRDGTVVHLAGAYAAGGARLRTAEAVAAADRSTSPQCQHSRCELWRSDGTADGASGHGAVSPTADATARATTCRHRTPCPGAASTAITDGPPMGPPAHRTPAACTTDFARGARGAVSFSSSSSPQRRARVDRALAHQRTRKDAAALRPAGVWPLFRAASTSPPARETGCCERRSPGGTGPSPTSTRLPHSAPAS